MLDVTYNVDISEDTIDNFLKDPINKTKINAAITRSLKLTTRWLATQTARGLSKDLDIALKGIRDRIYFSLDKTKEGKASIWVGLNDLHASAIGKMRQTQSGINVRGHSFRGAFVATPFKQGGGMPVDMGWRRASSKHQSGHDEVRNNKNEANQQRPQEHAQWPRYPLKKVGLKIEYEGEDWLERQERLIGQRFNTILQQQLNYEFNVKNQ